MTEYLGRFAPSPTGSLHFGSLVAAVASYLQARVNNGTWLVRIEDIDPPREPPEAKQQILDSLAIHGFHFAEPVFQSNRLDRYTNIIEQLVTDDLAYRCGCTRKYLQATAPAGRNGPIYPGTCRNGLADDAGGAQAVRLRTSDDEIVFVDALQGRQTCRLESESGDFLIRRGDGLVSYQLAVAIDDYDQGITEVVRGADLLDTTFGQIALLSALGCPAPAYLHIPIAVNAAGQKLAKQTGAPGLDPEIPVDNIYNSLFFLYQEPPETLKKSSLSALWDWATAHWRPDKLAGLRSRPKRVNITH